MSYQEDLDKKRDEFNTLEEAKAFLDGVEWELKNQINTVERRYE